MRKTLFMIIAVLMLVGVGAVMAADQPNPGDSKEVALVLEKGVKGEAKGKLVINTANGTDVAIQITGLDPKGLYTAFFVNVQSQMFEGIGEPPHVLKVNDKGDVDFKGTIKKDIYKRFVMVGIYLNPGGTPIANPVGVKSQLGPLVEKAKPKLILKGKLR
ncbi:MAG TPA: hypothetical protein VK654_00145 [Nitrospirota bacterium]|nr:hypothetical protein [Nitrospirota bacterium]